MFALLCACFVHVVFLSYLKSSFAFYVIKSIKCIERVGACSCSQVHAVHVKMLIALLSGRTYAARMLNVSFVLMMKTG